MGWLAQRVCDVLCTALFCRPAASAARCVEEETASAKPTTYEPSQLLCSVRLAASCSILRIPVGDAARSGQAGGCGTQARTTHSLCHPPLQSRGTLLDPSPSNPGPDWSLTSSSATLETVPLTRGCYRFFPSHILVHSANSEPPAAQQRSVVPSQEDNLKPISTWVCCTPIY
jgi:hypothetical protein